MVWTSFFLCSCVSKMRINSLLKNFPGTGQFTRTANRSTGPSRSSGSTSSSWSSRRNLTTSLIVKLVRLDVFNFFVFLLIPKLMWSISILSIVTALPFKRMGLESLNSSILPLSVSGFFAAILKSLSVSYIKKVTKKRNLINISYESKPF